MTYQSRFKSIALMLFCVVAIFGCRKKGSDDLEDSKENSEVSITCESLYQGDSIEEALTFMKVPENRRETTLQSIKKYGPLANHDELEFANRVFNISRTKKSSEYNDLLSRKMLELLEKKDEDAFLWITIDHISKGEFLYACCEESFYGPCEAQYAVTCDQMIPEEIPTNGPYWAQEPTHRFVFFHFHTPNNMIIGSTVYAIIENGAFKIVSESIKGIASDLVR
jgi:hypothetical protein